MGEKKVIVTVNEGKIRGIQKRSNFSGAEYFSFFGVPYGQSRAGTARFKDPVKVRPWKNVLDASVENKEGCFQYSLYLHRLAGSEDCLYSNIHTPYIPQKGDPLKAVIVYIHPGGLIHGSPETWCYGSPEYVMHRDVVYVCIAHRLHILGFLNLGLKECSGNQGLKDVILSLKWIKENIKSFGGDPNNVTLLGSSSGAASVHYLMLSPEAKGLFHKAVLMGMYAFNPTLITKIEHKKEAYECAARLGYKKSEENDDKKLLSFFKKPLQQFIQMRSELFSAKHKATLFPAALFSETVDVGENPVLPVSPDELIDSTARIPVMFGMCEREAAMGFMHGNKASTMKYFYSTYRQNSWGWGRDITDDQVQLIKKQIDDFYFKGGSLETAPLSLKIDVQTDASFSSVYNTMIDIIAKDLPSSVFVYKFQFDGNASTLKDKVYPLLDEHIEGSFHASDFGYWSYVNDFWKVDKGSLSPKSRKVVETFTKLITTFARTGNPNYKGIPVEWKPTTPEKPCYMNIDETLDMIDGKVNGKRMEFWENIQKQFKKN